MSRPFANMFRPAFGQRPGPYWALVIFLSLLFIMGGSSRSDTQSVSMIRPAAVLFLGYGLWNLKREHIASYRFHFVFALALLCLIALHLVPLPPIIWQTLASSDLPVEVSNILESSQTWQRISMSVDATWNALAATLTPFAVLVLASQLDRESRFRLLGIFLFFGLVSVSIGLLQAVGSSDSIFHLYRIRAGNFPSGLFANRNHYAVFLSCIIPMLAVHASLSRSSFDADRMQKWLAVAFCGLLIPLILITGSRAGLLTAALGILAVPFLYRKQKSTRVGTRKVQNFNPFYALGFAGVAAIVLVTIFAARAESFDRLFDDGGSADMRFAIWRPVWELIRVYQPLGTGPGSFAPVYQIDEPTALMTFQYVPHAHNDWLEVALTAGLPGLMLIGVGLVAFAAAGWHHFRISKDVSRDVIFGRLGVVIMALLIVASAVDYPLRVPSLGSLIIIAAIWAARGAGRSSKNAGSG